MPAPCPILLAARSLDQGGSERQLAEVAKTLDRAAFTPHVGAFREGGLRWRELTAAGVPLVSFSVPSFASVKGAAAIARYIRLHGIRLVHTFDTPAALYVVPAARLAGCPVVLSSQRAHRSLSGRPLYRHALRIVDRLVDGVVVNCRFMRRHLIEDEHVPAGLIRLCYNGVDVDVFQPAPRQRPEPLADASLVIGVVCALRPEKDLLTLVEAFAAARARRPGLKLAIVGSGECLPALQRQAAALGVDAQCVFHPATADVAPWLRGIDIFVLPSLTEALSNSIMEAMACGCCVVASHVGGNPELIADGDTGRLFTAGDARNLASVLVELIDSPKQRQNLARNAAARIRREFRLDVAARRMGAIYAGFLGDDVRPLAARESA